MKMILFVRDVEIIFKKRLDEWKNKIINEWKKTWPNIAIQFIIFVIIGFFFSWFITDALKPHTDISVECQINEGTNANYSLDVSFNNKADFAGKNFYVYLWNVKAFSSGGNSLVFDRCNRIIRTNDDIDVRFMFFCDFIPPKSKFDLSIESDLDENIVASKSIWFEWWGETTPHQQKHIQCN